MSRFEFSFPFFRKHRSKSHVVAHPLMVANQAGLLFLASSPRNRVQPTPRGWTRPHPINTPPPSLPLGVLAPPPMPQGKFPETPHFHPGHVLHCQNKTYTIQKQIGAGLFGQAFLALDSQRQEIVFKTARPETQTSLRDEEETYRSLEAKGVPEGLFPKTGQGFKDPNNGVYCLPMEKIEGVDASKLARTEPLSVSQALPSVLDKILLMKNCGILHNDLHPDNIKIRHNEGTGRYEFSRFLDAGCVLHLDSHFDKGGRFDTHSKVKENTDLYCWAKMALQPYCKQPLFDPHVKSPDQAQSINDRMIQEFFNPQNPAGNLPQVQLAKYILSCDYHGLAVTPNSPEFQRLLDDVRSENTGQTRPRSQSLPVGGDRLAQLSPPPPPPRTSVHSGDPGRISHRTSSQEESAISSQCTAFSISALSRVNPLNVSKPVSRDVKITHRQPRGFAPGGWV